LSDLKLEIYDSVKDINKNQWNSLVEQSELGSFFHRYEWLKAIESGIGFEAKHIVILKNLNPIAIFPNFITDIRKTPFKRLNSITPGFGGPLIVADEKEVLDLIFKKISKICKGTIVSHHISTLNLGYIRYGQYFEEKRYRANLSHCRFIIDLKKNYDDIKSNMSSGKRRKLNKISIDFEIKDEKINDEILEKFYIGYKKVMKRVGGFSYPFKFFTSLRSEVGDRMKIFNAVVDGKDAGKILCFLDTEQSSLHNFFSAIDESNFIFHSPEFLNEYAIKWGMSNNFKKYDFGSTSSSFDNSLFKFKEEFGGKIIPTLSWEKGYSLVGWNLLKFGKKLYKKN